MASINKQKLSITGFTLIEMAVLIMIVGVLLSMAVSFAIPVIENGRIIDTNQKMKVIKYALADYARANNRIPCPATPIQNANYGIEAGNGTALGSSGFRCASNVGMVPFATLGLDGNYALDGWGSILTYAVSPDFTISSVEAQTSVHAKCRGRDWFYASGRPINLSTPTLDVTPINPEKAAFCCAGNIVGNNLVVNDDAGNAVFPARSLTPLASAQTADTGQIINPISYNTLASPAGIAFVLVSHGANLRGTYNPVSGSRVNIPSSVCEAENTSDGNQVFRDCPSNENQLSAGFNDDITVWGTQDELMALVGASCSTP